MRRFHIVALACAAAWSPIVLAQHSQDFSQCFELARQQRLAEAEPFCARAAEEPGKEGRLQYADFLALKGDHDAALAQYAILLDDVELADATEAEFQALRNRAFLEFEARDPQADADAQAVLQLDPDDVELLRSGAHQSTSSGYRVAYAARLVQLDAKSLEYHVLYSYALVSARRPAEALAAAEQAIEVAPKSSHAWSVRGLAHGAAGDHAKAGDDHAMAARLAPNEAGPRLNLADSLVHLERYQEAIETADAALRLQPGHPRAHLIRATAELSLGNPEAALVDLVKADTASMTVTVEQLREAAQDMLEIQKVMTPASLASMESDLAVVVEGFGSDHVDATVLAAAARFEGMARWVERSEFLVCSKMPEKSRCIDDAVYSKAQAMIAGFDAPAAMRRVSNWRDAKLW